MAGPAAIRIGAVRRRSLEIAGLKVFSSLQGPAGERRTIYREACVAVIAIAIDIGNGDGCNPVMLAGTATRHARQVRHRASTLPSVIGNC